MVSVQVQRFTADKCRETVDPDSVPRVSFGVRKLYSSGSQPRQGGRRVSVCSREEKPDGALDWHGQC